MYEGEEGHVLTAPPVGYEADTLPEGGETLTFEGETYTYADWGFWQPSGGGYVVVDPPVGAEVSRLPDDAVAHDDEGEVTLYQFDQSYFLQVHQRCRQDGLRGGASASGGRDRLHPGRLAELRGRWGNLLLRQLQSLRRLRRERGDRLRQR